MTDRIKNKVWVGNVDEEEDFDVYYIRTHTPINPEIIDLKLKIEVSKDRIMDILAKKNKELYIKEYESLKNLIENATCMIEYMEKKDNDVKEETKSQISEQDNPLGLGHLYDVD